MASDIDRARLARHKARVDGVFDAPDARGWHRWSETVAGKSLRNDGRDVLVPAVIVAAALRIETDGDDVERIYFLDAEGVADDVVSRRLAVEPDDAVLMVLLAADPRCWYYEIRVALHLAERALDAHPGHPDVLHALTELRDRLEMDPLHVSGFFAQKVRPWLSRLIAQHAPGGLLDLSFVDQRCAWGRAAALAISHSAESCDGVGPFALHLASPRGTRASKQWWADTEQAMGSAWAPSLIAELTSLLGTTDLTPGDPEVDGHDAPPEQLVVATNVPLARGVVWAESFATDGDAAPRLGAAVLRAASTFRGWDGLTARCSKVARAGIHALAAIGSAAATDELTHLYDELELATLVREVGKALGYPESDIRAHIRR